MRGRLPKPTEMKRGEGTPVYGRGIEPLYPNVLPEKPKLSAAASRMWDELVSVMRVSGVLKIADAHALGQLCENEVVLRRAYDDFWKLAAKIKADAKRDKRELRGGEVAELLATEDGAALMRVIRDLGKCVVNERAQFGLTPASRARISVSVAERPGDSLIDDAVFNRPSQLLILPKA
jgi:P27 family predicted phage terminase small subunit